jgi:hypothetical protein
MNKKNNKLMGECKRAKLQCSNVIRAEKLSKCLVTFWGVLEGNSSGYAAEGTKCMVTASGCSFVTD